MKGRRLRGLALVRGWTLWRRLCQGATALFFLLLPLAASQGVTAVAGTLAALKVGPVDLVEPAAGASAVLAAISASFTLLAAILLPVLFALDLGPVFCSWLCPWGLVSEGLDRLRHGRRRPWPPGAMERLRRLRPGVFIGVMAASLLVAAPLAAVVSAPRLITVLPLELIVLGFLSPVTGGLLAALLALELAGPRRLWCRALCPAGTAVKLLRLPWTLTVRWLPERCNCPGSPLCQVRCPWGIDPRRMGAFDGCTNCFACIDACPGGSLAPAFGRPRRRRGEVQAPGPLGRAPEGDPK